jgi:hypothetical protein
MLAKWAQMGSKGISLTVLNFEPGSGGWSTPRPSRFTPVKPIVH